MSKLDKAKEILEYWYNMEYFKPYFPKQQKGDCVLYGNINQELPWINGKENTIYNLYIGKVSVESLLIKLHTAMGLKGPLEKEEVITCVGNMKFNHKGEYVKGSFKVNPFLFGITSLINAKNFDIEINEVVLNNFNIRVDCILENGYPKINEQENLVELEDLILSQLDYLNKGDFYCLIRPCEEGGIDLDESMVNSLYIKDISKILKSLKSEDKIINYVTINETYNSSKIQIDRDIEAMKKWTFPNRYPMGKWPSTNPLSLMEQIEINISISEDKDAENIISQDNLASIRKEILLKEVIANNIVERALELSKYDDPNNVFSMRKLKNPKSDFYKTYYKFPMELEKYSIVVASSNDSVIENIVSDLQSALDTQENKTHTGKFDINVSEEVYFSDIATRLTGKTSWGLMAANLGNEESIKKLKSVLNTNKNQPFGSYFNNALKIVDWDEAKKNFIEQYNIVKGYEEEIASDATRVYSINIKKEELNEIIDKKIKINREIEEIQLSIEEISKMEKDNLEETQAVSENIVNAEANASFFKRLSAKMFKKSKLNIELNILNEKKEELIERYSELQTLKINLENELPSHLDKLKLIEEKYKSFQLEYENEIKAIEAIEQKYNNNLSQKLSPWTNAEYDKLREELFYRALVLQKSFVQNANGVKQNIRMLCKAWDGNVFFESDKEEFFKDIFHTLFLVIPVVTTNFTFIQTLFQYIGKEELGTLIVDESGQLETRLAIGALWRVRKAIARNLLPIDGFYKDLSKIFID